MKFDQQLVKEYNSGKKLSRRAKKFFKTNVVVLRKIYKGKPEMLELVRELQQMDISEFLMGGSCEDISDWDTDDITGTIIPSGPDFVRENGEEVYMEFPDGGHLYYRKDQE